MTLNEWVNKYTLEQWAQKWGNYTPTEEDKARKLIEDNPGIYSNTARKEAHKAELEAKKVAADTYLDRMTELLSKADWTKEDRIAAGSLLKEMRGNSFDNFISTFTGKGAQSPMAALAEKARQTGDYTEYRNLMELYAQLDNRYHGAQSAFVTGLAQGTGATSIAKAGTAVMSAMMGDEGKGMIGGQADYLNRLTRESAERNPLAAAVGNVFGTLSLMGNIASGIGAIKGFANLPKIAQAIISSGGSFGGAEAIQGLGGAVTGERGWGDYALDVGVGTAAGALGGVVSGGIGALGVKFLQSKGLAGNMLARTVLAGLSGAGFVAGRAGVTEPAAAIRDPENYELDFGKLATDALVGFAFSAFSFLSNNYTEGFKTAAQKDQAAGWAKKYFKNMTLEEAKAAYRNYVKQYHPDLYATADTATQQAMSKTMAEINGAWAYINATRGAEAYQAAQAAQSSGDTAAYNQATADFVESVNALQTVAGTGIATPEAAQAAEILKVVAADMVGGAVASADAPATAPTTAPQSTQDGLETLAYAPTAPQTTTPQVQMEEQIQGPQTPQPEVQVQPQTSAVEGTEAIQSEKQKIAELEIELDPEHIDNRTAESVAARKMTAFQYKHPQFRKYYREMAEILQMDAAMSDAYSGMRTVIKPGTKGKRTLRYKRVSTDIIDTAMDKYGLSRPRLIKILDDIIKDQGAENYADAKRVELLLDDMLSHGYKTIDGREIPPNQEYLAEKAKIPGANGNVRDRARYEAERDNFIAIIMSEEGISEEEALKVWERLEAREREQYGTGAEQQTEEQQPPTNSVGAMGYPYPRRQKVSEFYSNTLKNTDILSDETKAQLDEKDFVFDSISEKESVAGAQQRLSTAFNYEVGELASMRAYESAEDVDTAMGILKAFAQDADTNRDYSLVKGWAKDVYEKTHKAAVTLQALDKYSRTPEGAVLKAVQLVNIAEKELTTKKELGKDVDNELGRQVKADTEAVKKAISKEAKEIVSRDHDLAVEWWLRDTAKKLAARIDKNAKGKSANVETTMQIILKDLLRLTKDAAPQAETNVSAQRKTATETLRNYWANPEQYEGIVQRAQRYINEKYKDSPEILEIFNDWLAGGGIDTWNLIGRALQENGVKYNKILMEHWLNKIELLNRVTNEILADTDLTEEEAQRAAKYIADKFYDELARRAEAKIAQLLEPKKPRAKKTMMTVIKEYVNAGVFDDDAISTLVNIKYGIPYLTSADIQKIYEFSLLAEQQKSDYMRRAFEDKAAQVVTNRMPTNIKKKILAARRIAMMMSPKTFFSRNAGGNVFLSILEDIKDIPGTVIDILVSKKTGRRETSFNPIATAKAEAKGFKKGVTEWLLDIKYGVNTSPTEHEMPRAPSFEGKLGRALEQFLNKALQLGDRPFFEAAYAKRLDELRRLGWDINSQEAIEDATAYALERVFQNDSEFAKRAYELRRSLGVFGDIAIPFAQFPANVFDKLLDYSPIGFARAIEKFGSIGDSGWSQKQFTDTLARAITGIGIILLGYFGCINGLITGGDDDKSEKEEYMEKQAGKKPYAININGTYYTYDTFGLVGALLALGANMAQASNGEEALMAILLAGMNAGINTMFNQSYLEGLSELFGSGDIAKNLENMLVSLPASFVPTFFKQVAWIVDDVMRDTYDTDPVKRAWNKVKAQIPGLSKTLPPVIGAKGEEMKRFQNRGMLSNIFESLLSPGYIGQNVQSGVDKEIMRVYEATGNTDVLPKWKPYTSKNDLSLTYRGKKYQLTMDELKQIQRVTGNTTYQYMNALLNSDAYKELSVEQQAKVMADIISFAEDKARREYLQSRGVNYTSTWDKVQDMTQKELAIYLAYKHALDSASDTTGKDAKSLEALADNYNRMSEQEQAQLDNLVGSTLDKVMQAISAGIDAADFFRLKQKLSDYSKTLSNQEAKEKWRNELLKNSSFTAAQKNLLDSLLVSDGFYISKDVEVDYSSPDSFKLSQMSDAARENYNAYAKGKVDVDTFQKVYGFYTNATSDKDKNGKTIKSRKEKVVEYINSLNLTREQKTALYLACGYKESTLDDVPW